MILRQGRNAAWAIVAAALLVGGCTKIEDHMGYVMDDTLIAAIQPGVDNRDSVQNTLGSPTFTGQFNTDDWYYVSRNTRNMAFNMPHPESQTILRIRFDQTGNVTAVDKRGMEQVASITPSSDKTPTLGRDKNLLESLFGNIGAVGTSQTPNTTDNPH